MLRSGLTWVIAGAVIALVGAAVVDAVRPSGGSPEVQRKPSRGGSVFEARDPILVPTTGALPLERCSEQQLALRFDRLGGSPVLALAHVWGSPCRSPRLRLAAAVFAENGDPIEATVGLPPAFAQTNLSAGIEVIAGLQVDYLCGQPAPRLLVAEAGPYVVRGRLPRGFGACLDDLGP